MAKSKRKERDRRGSKSARHSSGAAQTPQPTRFSRLFVRVFPVVIVLLALGLWLGAKSPRAAAIAGALGAFVWLMFALGAFGSQVPPRDSTRAGAIDFGKRN